jgi:hypothetical protein
MKKTVEELKKELQKILTEEKLKALKEALKKAKGEK